MSKHYYDISKRLFDIILSFFLLVMMLPVVVGASIMIAVTSEGPIVFKQKRVGRGGRLFTCYKFRSMIYDADQKQYIEFIARAFKDAYGNGVPNSHLEFKKDDSRVTKIGRFLRVTSIDELPQLMNVLKGEMSLIGPRPDVPESVALYSASERRRLEVKPGITGLWQVNGRSTLTLREMFVLDNFYVDNKSLLLDLRILIKTVFVVIIMRGSG